MKEKEIVEIREKIGKGTHGGLYVYVVEGDSLVHISEYAIRKLPGKRKDEIIYEVPKDKLVGKIMYCFDFSGRGRGSLIKCKIEDFEDGHPKKHEYLESLGKRIQELENLRFRLKDTNLSFLLTQFEEIFTPIIREIKEYENAQNFKIWFMGHQRRLENAFRNPRLYYFTFMSLPNDKSRIRSLKVIRRWIYRLWVLKLLCEALEVFKFKKHEYEGTPYWWVEQGSDLSTGIAETPFGDITFWIEFQPHKGAHMIGMFTKRRVAIRPDIVVVKGYFERTKDFTVSKKPIDLIVECKEDPFDKWKKEIDSQILPYQEAFKPKNFIIASLESVPEAAKENLNVRGIEVIDNLKPKSKSIRILHDMIREKFER